MNELQNRSTEVFLRQDYLVRFLSNSKQFLLTNLFSLYCSRRLVEFCVQGGYIFNFNNSSHFWTSLNLVSSLESWYLKLLVDSAADTLCNVTDSDTWLNENWRSRRELKSTAETLFDAVWSWSAPSRTLNTNLKYRTLNRKHLHCQLVHITTLNQRDLKKTRTLIIKENKK